MTGVDLTEALRLVFLEPRDDYWGIHVPDHVSVDEQRAYRLVPKATAHQLENVFYCEDCFPYEASERDD